MKQILITAIALAFGLMFLFYRRRLKLAVLVAGGLYAVLTAVRLVVMREEVDRFTQLGLALATMGGLWLATNLLTGLLERRRRGRVRR